MIQLLDDDDNPIAVEVSNISIDWDSMIGSPEDQEAAQKVLRQQGVKLVFKWGSDNAPGLGGKPVDNSPGLGGPAGRLNAEWARIRADAKFLAEMVRPFGLAWLMTTPDAEVLSYYLLRGGRVQPNIAIWWLVMELAAQELEADD